MVYQESLICETFLFYMEKKYRSARHDKVAPLIDNNCHTLLLGSMLSPKSAEAEFYYAHPQNRFWSVLAAVFDSPPVISRQERAELALSNGIALWDVIFSCEIVGASDSTIKNVVYNDLDGLLKAHPNITRVFTTGGKAHELLLKYNKQIKNPIICNAIRLPSTSPLNCAAKLEDLIKAYSVIKTE